MSAPTLFEQKRPLIHSLRELKKTLKSEQKVYHKGMYYPGAIVKFHKDSPASYKVTSAGNLVKLTS
jgi:hypothetical protein